MKLIVTSEADLNGGLFENPERRYDVKYSEFCTRPDKSEFQTLSYLPKEKRTSICVRSTFLATWAYVASQGLLCHLRPTQLNLYEPASTISMSDRFQLPKLQGNSRANPF
jgi:hypothetical protein